MGWKGLERGWTSLFSAGDHFRVYYQGPLQFPVFVIGQDFLLKKKIFQLRGGRVKSYGLAGRTCEAGPTRF